MSILIDRNTRVVVQGITGGEGTFHAQRMIEYGTKVVAGVTPGKGGTRHLEVPVFNTVAEAVAKEGANAAAIFVPPFAAADAIMEAADAGRRLVVCITEGIPTFDMIKAKASSRGGRWPHRPQHARESSPPGNARSASCRATSTQRGDGRHHQPVGNAHLRGGAAGRERRARAVDRRRHRRRPDRRDEVIDLLKLFREDKETEAVILIGEIGGTAEEEAAAYIKQEFPKPVVSFIAGQTAPPGRRMGHAGAIIAGGKGTATSRRRWRPSRLAGVFVAKSPADIGRSGCSCRP
jgi:succinyl-CoA synthetase alpha subunit